MPMVTVWPTPKGSPIASTRSPTWTASLSPNGTVGRRSPLVSILRTARSVRGSAVQHLGLEFALVVQRHHDVGAALHHMIVGEDQAVGAHDHAGAQRLLHALAHLRRGAEELREEGIVEKRIDLNLGDRAGIDIHHRGRDALHHRREGQLHLPHRGRLGLVARRGARRSGCGATRCVVGGGALAPGMARNASAAIAATPAAARDTVFISATFRNRSRFNAPPQNCGISKPSQQTKRAASLPPPNSSSDHADFRLRPLRPLPPGRNPCPWRRHRGRRTR